MNYRSLQYLCSAFCLALKNKTSYHERIYWTATYSAHGLEKGEKKY